MHIYFQVKSICTILRHLKFDGSKLFSLVFQNPVRSGWHIPIWEVQYAVFSVLIIVVKMITLGTWNIQKLYTFKEGIWGTSLVVQWLRLCFQCRECGFDPGWGSRIPKKKKKKKKKTQSIRQKQYCNKFRKDLKKWSTHTHTHIQKKRACNNGGWPWVWQFYHLLGDLGPLWKLSETRFSLSWTANFFFPFGSRS